MIIYFDMDGFVADFRGACVEHYGCIMADMKNSVKNKFWDVECVSKQFFANLPPIYEGIALVEGIERALGDKDDVALWFLTSTGGGHQHVGIAQQKLEFLRKHNLAHIPVAFSRNTQDKASLATSHSVLIDDREKVTEAFQAAGGVAYLFKPDRGLKILNSVVEMHRCLQKEKHNE